MWDTVINSYNGFLSKLGDINDLEDKFKLFISNQDLIQEMGKNSVRVEDLYDVKKINHAMISSITIKCLKPTDPTNLKII